jgi:hypothetical protein
MAEGEYVGAATVFARLSGGARNAGMMVRTGELALRAARAYLAAGRISAAADWASKGLRALARGGRVERVSRVLERVAEELRSLGHDTEAAQLEQDVVQVLSRYRPSPEAGVQPPSTGADPGTTARGTLPAQCTGCGAPLVSDEVEWHDPLTAECVYCGTLAKAGRSPHP